MFLDFCGVFPQTGEYTGKCNGNVRGPKPQHSKNTYFLEVFHHFQGHQAPSKSACFLNVPCFFVMFPHTLVNKTSTFKKHIFSRGFPPCPERPSPIQKCMLFECFFFDWPNLFWYPRESNASMILGDCSLECWTENTFNPGVCLCIYIYIYIHIDLFTHISGT